MGRTGSKGWILLQMWKMNFVLASDGSWSSLLLGSESRWWSSGHTVDMTMEVTSQPLSFLCSWSRDGNGSIIYPQQNGLVSSKPLLEFVAIQRKDTKQWALPGVSDRARSRMKRIVLLSGYGRSRWVCLSNYQTGIPRRSQPRWNRSRQDRSALFQWTQNLSMVHGWSQKYWQCVDRVRGDVSSIAVDQSKRLAFFARHFHDEQGQLTKDLHLNAGKSCLKCESLPSFF